MSNLYNFASGTADLDQAVELYRDGDDQWMVLTGEHGDVCFLWGANGGELIEIPDPGADDQAWNQWLPKGVAKPDFLSLLSDYDIY
jgi:hypothetical protein